MCRILWQGAVYHALLEFYFISHLSIYYVCVQMYVYSGVCGWMCVYMHTYVHVPRPEVILRHFLQESTNLFL